MVVVLNLVITAKSKCLGFDMFTRPMLSWIWLTTKFKCFRSDMFVKLILPWIWLITKSKCFEFYMFVKPTLPWIWLTTKSRCLEFDMFIRLTLPWIWHVCQTHVILDFGGLSSSSALDLLDLPNSNAFQLTNYQVQVFWVRHVCQTQITLNLMDYQVHMFRVRQMYYFKLDWLSSLNTGLESSYFETCPFPLACLREKGL